MTAFGLVIGDRIGPYVITGELGEGGMGIVYRAMHVLLNRPVAIKVLRPELGSNAMTLDRFLNEARATTAVRHPGIVAIYDYGHTEIGSAYIAMELLQGESLGSRLAARGRLPVAEALTILRRIAAPLAVAHAAGIVHRDLKPDNVFLVRDPEGGAIDQVKVLDFGIAKLDSAPTHCTTIGVVLGTPAYMAPEQCLGAASCDHRADLYALGCILFELITGAPPFGRHGAINELMGAHLNAAVPTPANLDPSVARLLHALLAKSPDDRPRSAIDVVTAIDACFTPSPLASPGARTTLRLGLATVAGLALTLASIGAWYRVRKAPRPELALGAPPAARGSVIEPLVSAGRALADDLGRVAATAATLFAGEPALEPSPPRLTRPPPTTNVRARRHVPTDSQGVIDDLGTPTSAFDVNTTVSH